MNPLRCAGIRRYCTDGSVFHYVAPSAIGNKERKHEPHTLCGKAADSPTLSPAWMPPGTAPVKQPELCAECRAILLNARARDMLDEARALIEDAQHMLYKAAQACGGVAMGGSLVNDKCAALGSKAHALWRYTSYDFLPRHAKRLTLDYANTAPFLNYYEQYGGDAGDPIQHHVREAAKDRKKPSRIKPRNNPAPAGNNDTEVPT